MGLSLACWMEVPFCPTASGYVFTVSAYFLEIRRKQPIETLRCVVFIACYQDDNDKSLIIRAINEGLRFV